MWAGLRAGLVFLALIASVPACRFDSSVGNEIGDPGGPRRDEPDPDPSFCEQACPAVGGTCDGDVCEIVCLPGQAGCDRPSCPSGLSCRIRCEGADACANGVDCSAGDGCEITCDGGNACSGDITCGGGPCDVECRGFASCPRVECQDACRCDVSCGSPGSCMDQLCPEREGLTCTGLVACTSARSPLCDSCDGPTPISR